MGSALGGDFLPATGLGGNAALAAQAQHARDGTSDAENQENAADELHEPQARAGMPTPNMNYRPAPCRKFTLYRA